MPGTLQKEIQQTKPFQSLEQEALLSIERTAAMLLHRGADTFRPHGITQTQYNVLRILKGAGRDGLCRNEIRDRLIAQVPDVTRLLDRMEEAELISRERDTVDRRQVTTRITKHGLKLLDKLAESVSQAHRREMGQLTPKQLETLIELLAIVRAAP
jgi:DNA-binding MarR family transcriptional regulator